MLAAQRFEIAPPPPAISLAGEDLASGSTTWTALPRAGETTFSTADSCRELDYMHARFRSPLTGRFLSVDAGAARVRRPQSWNRYAYAMGNPLKYVDDDGNEIRVAWGDGTFNALVNNALAAGERSHPRLASMIQALRSSSFVHSIEQVSGTESSADPRYDPDASNGVGTGSTIRLSLTTLGENGDFMTVLDALMHELSHGEDNDTGTANDSRPCSTCPPSDEQKAVRIQNLTGGKPQTTYGGQPVPNPTAVPPQPKKKPKKDKTDADPEPENY